MSTFLNLANKNIKGQAYGQKHEGQRQDMRVIIPQQEAETGKFIDGLVGDRLIMQVQVG